MLAEDNGFDSVWVSDHFSPWRHTDGHSPFAFAVMGALGERTRRVEIGTSVLTPTFRYHPSIVAQAMGTLAAMYPGRILLGVGTGEGMNEVTATGIEWPGTSERFARLKEAIALMKKLWTEELVTFEGQFYKTYKATIYDRPDKRCPCLSQQRARRRPSWLAARPTASSALAARTGSSIEIPLSGCRRRRGAGKPREGLRGAIDRDQGLL